MDLCFNIFIKNIFFFSNIKQKDKIYTCINSIVECCLRYYPRKRFFFFFQVNCVDFLNISLKNCYGINWHFAGTSNWSGDYFIDTGGIGLVVNQNVTGTPGNVRLQLQEIFYRDWDSRYATNIDHFNFTIKHEEL